MKRTAWSSLTLLALCALLLVGLGCDSNKDVTALEGKGKINVTPRAFPNDLGAEFPWTLTGPGGYSHSDTGSVLLEDLAIGEYTLTWNPLNGWVVPSPSTQTATLVSGGTHQFIATYRQTGQAQPDQVQLDPNPDTINDGAGAPWTLTDPDGNVTTGTGDATFEDMPAGSYTVVWGEVGGWQITAPATGTQTASLVEGEGLTFSATYASTEASSIEFVEIPAGEFVMGSATNNSASLPYEWPNHSVTLTRGFLMSETEVTWAQYEFVMDENPTSFPGRDWPSHPVDSVTWLEAAEFCNALSAIEGLTPAYAFSGDLVTWNRDADGYRLPTEAEWEYACRAGTTSEYYNGTVVIEASSCYSEPNLEEIGWYCNNAEQVPQEVAQLAPNPWGLYDMSGNLWEWVWDVNTSYDAVSMYMDPFYTAIGEDPVTTGNVYVAAQLADFGDSQVLRVVDALARFDLSAMGITTNSVQFQFLDFGGVQNFRVNGLPEELYIGSLADLPSDLVPGVSIAVSTVATTHDTYGDGVIGTVTLTGDIETIEIGGSLLWIDSFAIDDADTGPFGLDRFMGFDLKRLNSFYLPDGNPITVEALFGLAVTDPVGVVQTAGAVHMLRGGSYGSVPRRCRSAARSEPAKGRYAGFRVVRDLP
ncbi:MAG TPA: formylglycine-generating enzyme family protein [Candidatus Krumholzibacteria bacterium]|nr:formylglycine-generating enzyme family protein [Candidatus Krumholzibacteria bacterium]HRX49961.1 formylglycine-generating enzyme family protein [Candidatus Krumholzibacteria bacterium]